MRLNELRREPLWLAALAVACGTAVILVLAGQRELWLDETHSMHLAQMPATQMWEYVRGDVHPPLYFLLLSALETILGNSPVALRMLSLAAHVVGALLFYALCVATFARRDLSVVGAILFMFSPALIYHAGDARMYSLAVLLAVLLLLVVTRYLKQPTDLRSALPVGIVAALGFYTHYASLFFAAGMFLFLGLRFLKNHRALKSLLVSALVFALAVAPWAPVVLDQRERKSSQAQEKALSRSNGDALTYGPAVAAPKSRLVTVRAYAENVASISGVLPANSPLLTFALSLPILASFGFALRSAVLRTGERELVFMLVLLAASSSVGPALLGLEGRRYLLNLAPLAILAIVLGLGAVWRPGRSESRGIVLGVGVLALFLAGAVRVASQPKERPFELGASFLGAYAEPGDPVVVSALYAQVPLDYYLRREGAVVATRGFPMDIYSWWESQAFKGWGGPIILREDLNRFLREFGSLPAHNTVWVVQFESDHYDPHGELLRAVRGSSEWSVSRCSLPPSVGSQLEIYAITRPQSSPRAAACRS